jgi:hypothetical protein
MSVKFEHYCPSKMDEATTQPENTFMLLTPNSRSLNSSRPPHNSGFRRLMVDVPEMSSKLIKMNWVKAFAKES